MRWGENGARAGVTDLSSSHAPSQRLRKTSNPWRDSATISRAHVALRSLTACHVCSLPIHLSGTASGSRSLQGEREPSYEGCRIQIFIARGRTDRRGWKG